MQSGKAARRCFEAFDKLASYMGVGSVSTYQQSPSCGGSIFEQHLDDILSVFVFHEPFSILHVNIFHEYLAKQISTCRNIVAEMGFPHVSDNTKRFMSYAINKFKPVRFASALISTGAV